MNFFLCVSMLFGRRDTASPLAMRQIAQSKRTIWNAKRFSVHDDSKNQHRNEPAENESFQKVTKYLEIDCDNNTQHSRLSTATFQTACTVHCVQLQNCKQRAEWSQPKRKRRHKANNPNEKLTNQDILRWHCV